MKKYRLKKDLPTFKVGQECWLNAAGYLVTEVLEGDRLEAPHAVWKEVITVYTRSTLEKFPEILTEWFEEIPEEPKTVWDLKDGDEYFDINDFMKIGHGYFTSCDELIQHQLEVGDIFLTKEEAEKELAWRKAREILKLDTNGFKPDWENQEQAKYYVFCDCPDRDLVVDVAYTYCFQHIHFANRKDAEASIAEHRKEWFTYLGVEEDE